MKKVPNILSSARIVLAFFLLVVKPLGIQFFTIYIACGLTDLADGFLARRFKASSALGSRLDSIGDVVLTLITLSIILPIVQLPIWMLVWLFLILSLRLVTVGVTYYRFRKIALLHTTANRLVALVLYLLPFSLLFSNTLPVPLTLFVVASFAAIEELLINARASTLNPDVKSYRAAFSDTQTSS